MDNNNFAANFILNSSVQFQGNSMLSLPNITGVFNGVKRMTRVFINTSIVGSNSSFFSLTCQNRTSFTILESQITVNTTQTMESFALIANNSKSMIVNNGNLVCFVSAMKFFGFAQTL